MKILFFLGVLVELLNILMRRNLLVGILFWMVFEVIVCEQQFDYSYDVRCDIWFFGIIVIEFVDGITLFFD